MLSPVGLGEDTLLVGVKPSFGGLLELGDGHLDVVAQQLGGYRVHEGGKLVQGGLATVDPVPLGVGGAGDAGVVHDEFSRRNWRSLNSCFHILSL